jgi:endoglucanase
MVDPVTLALVISNVMWTGCAPAAELSPAQPARQAPAVQTSLDQPVVSMTSTVGGAAGAVAATAGSSAAGSIAGASTDHGSGGMPSVAGSASGAGGEGGKPTMLIGFVREHGALHVSGTHIVDDSGHPVQLRGMSLFWSQWSSYYQANTVDQLADDWRAGIVRAALGVESDGYLDNPAENEAKVVTIVEQAIARGMYVVIDWHDSHALQHQSAASEFFTRMATKYGASPNVLFEIFNEPLDVEWSSVKSYAEAIIAAIRGAGAKNVVIVGTPNWSQDVDIAARDPITSDHDVAYTLHFYAATHKQALRAKAKTALDAGLPLFVTEWGTCASSGDGAVDESETKAWLDFLSQNQISWINWALNDKVEACSALAPSAGAQGPWIGGALTQSGALVKAQIP